MARRGSNSGGRGYNTTATYHVPATLPTVVIRPVVFRPATPPPPNRALDWPTLAIDRRRWHPAGIPPPGATNRLAARLRARNAPSNQVGFTIPDRIALCRRREARKRVLHAKGVAGGRVRPPRRNLWSDVSCKG